MANDANIIKIKRSGTAGAPSSLKLGELAYSYLTATGNPTDNGGDRLFIGANGVNGSGNANDVIVIGGKYFTDLLDHARGTLTASSALIVDSDKKLDELLVDNLSLNGNTLSTTNSNLNVILSANGTGLVQINTSTNSFTLPTTRTSVNGYVLTAQTDGTTSWAASASSLTLTADTLPGVDTSETINLLTDTLQLAGDSGAISTTVTVTGTTNKTYKTAIAARLASTSQTGVASFNSSTFSVSVGGEVTVSSSGISNTQLVNSTLYIGTTQVTLGDASGTTSSLGVDITGKATTAGTADQVAYSLSNGNNIQSFSYDGSGTATVALATTLTDVDSISSSAGTGGVTLNASGGHSWTFNTDGTTTFNSAYTLPAADGSSGYVLTTDGTGNVTWEQASSSLGISGDSGTGTIDLLTQSLTIAGSGAISTSAGSQTLTVSVATADNSTLGVASFDSTNFTVTSGAVSITASSISNSQLVNSSFYIGTTNITLGDATGTTTSLGVDITGNAATVTDGVYTTDSGTVTNTMLQNSTISGVALGNNLNALTNGANIQSFSYDGGTGSVQVALADSISLTDVEATNFYTTDLTISGSTIESGNTIGDVVLVANGGGTDKTYTFGGDGNLAVAGKITNVTDPTSPQDAATKAYVDATASGLHIHAPAMVATTVSLTATYDNGTSGVGATLTFATPVNTLDSYSLANEDRILVKNQADAKQNGVYVRTSSTVWTRAADFNQITEITGADFLFVQKGASGGSTGWVQTDKVVSGVGSSDVTFVQFSAANSYLAGDGIDITGNTIKVKLDTNSGLSVSSGSLTISGIAGTAATTGLTYSAGVLQIGTDGTSIDINASGNLEIKSTWSGQSAITTVGTISSGTWHGTVIAETYGGTNQSSYAKGDILYASAANTLSKLTAGTNGQMLQLQDGLPVWADLDGGTYGP